MTKAPFTLPDPTQLNSTQLAELSRIGQCEHSHDATHLNSTQLNSTGIGERGLSRSSRNRQLSGSLYISSIRPTYFLRSNYTVLHNATSINSLTLIASRSFNAPVVQSADCPVSNICTYNSGQQSASCSVGERIVVWV